MHSTLIIYSSTDGHTETICKRISNFLDNKNETKIISLDDATKLDLSTFNKIIIGASIRYGKHSKKLYKFITLNKKVLDQKQSILVKDLWTFERSIQSKDLNWKLVETSDA